MHFLADSGEERYASISISEGEAGSAEVSKRLSSRSQGVWEQLTGREI